MIKQLSNADYHATPAISNSLISKILRSPAHARAYLDGSKETTPAMAFGSAFHSCILEPELFELDYAVFEGDKRTKEGKAQFQLLQEQGKTIISDNDFQTITSMSVAIREHPVARALLANGVAEQSVFWTDETTGLECKCRPDWWDGYTIVDLKSTEDASPAAFARSVFNYGYHRQAYWYTKGTGAKRFIFIAVEKKPPFAIGIYELDQVALDLGEAEVIRALAYWENCCEVGYYPAYQEEIVKLSLPSFAMKGIEE